MTQAPSTGDAIIEAIERLTSAEIDDIEGTIDAALEMTGPAMEAAGVAQWLTNTTFEALKGARRLVAHVRALHDALAAAEAERDGFKAALAEIRDNYGQVCGWFEICVHEPCRASCASWMVADKALRAPDAEGGSDA